jgi:hypothetical protein
MNIYFFQEIEFFTNSLNQLKLAQSKYVESQESLNKVCPESKDKEILVPLTSSVSFTKIVIKNNSVKYMGKRFQVTGIDLNFSGFTTPENSFFIYNQ